MIDKFVNEPLKRYDVFCEQDIDFYKLRNMEFLLFIIFFVLCITVTLYFLSINNLIAYTFFVTIATLTPIFYLINS